MILSYFLRNREIHIALGTKAKICSIDKGRDMADEAPKLIHDFITTSHRSTIDKIAFQCGPNSCITSRTISSIAVGLSISFPSAQFITIPSSVSYTIVAANERLPYKSHLTSEIFDDINLAAAQIKACDWPFVKLINFIINTSCNGCGFSFLIQNGKCFT
jgi:hypothetical protein